MSFYVYFIFVINICLSIVLYGYFKRPVEELFELNTCPYCYGTDGCELFVGDVNLETNSVTDFIFNYVSVKNVYFVKINNTRLVMKKLAHTNELDLLNGKICDGSEKCDLTKTDGKNYSNEIIYYLNNTNNINFKMCNQVTTDNFYQDLLLLRNSGTEDEETFLKQTWTKLQVNIEPLLLQLLKSEEGWPVPKYLGACGRTIMVEYCGRNLNNYAEYDWKDRAYVALQLLQAARDFTDKHNKYRFYLTDISPDNIAVDDALKVTFIDLENVIVNNKNTVEKECVHESEFFVDEEIVFSEKNICDSCLSDHNIYMVCKYLLSDDAPWPMMKGGLLHSPPIFISKNFNKLFVLIKFCVRPNLGMDRFEISQDLIRLLNIMLFKETL